MKLSRSLMLRQGKLFFLLILGGCVLPLSCFSLDCFPTSTATTNCCVAPVLATSSSNSLAPSGLPLAFDPAASRPAVCSWTLRVCAPKTPCTLLASTNCERSRLSVADPIPPITALNQDGKLVSLNEVFARGTTLVYFYPKADTPGCTAEACSLRDDWEILKDASGKKIQIVGVSKDSPEAQKKFQQKYHLPFDLIADVDGKVAKIFGVPLIPIIGVLQRQSFLVKQGKVVWSSSHAKTKDAAREVQHALDIANAL